MPLPSDHAVHRDDGRHVHRRLFVPHEVRFNKAVHRHGHVQAGTHGSRDGCAEARFKSHTGVEFVLHPTGLRIEAIAIHVNRVQEAAEGSVEARPLLEGRGAIVRPMHNDIVIIHDSIKEAVVREYAPHRFNVIPCLALSVVRVALAQDEPHHGVPCYQMALQPTKIGRPLGLRHILVIPTLVFKLHGLQSTSNLHRPNFRPMLARACSAPNHILRNVCSEVEQYGRNGQRPAIPSA
mmetsp:Transcript_43362/g.114179  ORF Transcript_43362/g.114179 Transcript_43362/m.114179 type:complete len:237 (+) Transcript_43362:258-968(+)